MKTEGFTPRRFRLLPIQVIEVDGGFVVRRGAEQFSVMGEGSAGFLRLLGQVMDAGHFSVEELAGKFAGPDRDKVMFVLRQLAVRGMVVDLDDAWPADERSEDVFYWNHGTTAARVRSALADLDIALAGIGEVTVAMARSLHLAGVSRITVIDDPVLRTMSFWKDDGLLANWPAEMDVQVIRPEAWPRGSSRDAGLLVGCSDFGARQLLLPWNEACVETGTHFLPVLLKDLTGWIGPLVIPGETACHACALTRLNMHLDAHEPAVELAMATGQVGVAGHPLMAAALADFAVMGLVAIHGGFSTSDPDALLEIDFSTMQCRSRRVWKVPRCPVCSSVNRYPETDLYPLQPLPA